MRRQSEHLARLRRSFERLEQDGLLYPAFESRAEIARLVAEQERRGAWPRDPDGAPLYPGTRRRCRSTSAGAASTRGAPYALRLDMAAAKRAPDRCRGRSRAAVRMARPARSPARPEQWGDVILARKETPTSYHLSVVIDDALQGVTHVVRGQDLFWATSVHRLLQALLGLPPPVTVTMAGAATRRGRSSRNRQRATALRELRAAGCRAGGRAAPVGV